MIDLLVKNARYLITMDEQRRIFQNGALAVDGARILAVGATVEIEKRFPAADPKSEPHLFSTWLARFGRVPDMWRQASILRLQLFRTLDVYQTQTYD